MLTGNVPVKDYNFFSGFQAENRAARNKAVLVVLGFVLLAVLVGGFYIYMEVKASTLEKDIVRMKEFLNSSETMQKRREIEEKKKKFEVMNKYLTAVEAAASGIDSMDRIKGAFFQSIVTTVPRDVTFKTMALTPEQLNIQGVMADRVTIAEFHHNLMALGLFKDVHLVSIQKDTTAANGSSYNIQCKLKDGIKP